MIGTETRKANSRDLKLENTLVLVNINKKTETGRDLREEIMANNYMMLVCEICNPENEWHFDRVPRPIFRLAKYYPVGEFYTAGERDYALRLDKFFTDHKHDEVSHDQMVGGTWFRLDYESEGWVK